MKKDETGSVCSTHDRREMHIKVYAETLKELDTFGGTGVDE
jgi:hypothetical protein